jgi:acetylornithine deacetylase/succinyl-diaminopimelate desuccinylase-like protein
MMEKTDFKKYIDDNSKRFLSELFDLLKIQSVSSESDKKSEIARAAEFVKDQFEQLHVDKAEICETAGNPIVYAEKSSTHRCLPSWYMATMMCNRLIR